jgi:hypothetical protein
MSELRGLRHLPKCGWREDVRNVRGLMRRQVVVLNLGGRTAGMTGKESARLKRRLKNGPRLTRKARAEYARWLIAKAERKKETRKQGGQMTDDANNPCKLPTAVRIFQAAAIGPPLQQAANAGLGEQASGDDRDCGRNTESDAGQSLSESTWKVRGEG